MEKKKLDKERIEEFVSLGIPKLLIAAYAKAIGSVTVMQLVDINEKNGKLKYVPVPEDKLSEAITYVQKHGNNVLEATTPKSYNPESGELPPTIVFVQQEPDIRAFELLLAHSIGRPIESLKVEQNVNMYSETVANAKKKIKEGQAVPTNVEAWL